MIIHFYFQCTWMVMNNIQLAVASLNVKITEMVIFKSKQNKFEGDFKIKLCENF